MVALDSRCRQVDFAARVPSNCCKWLSGETPASSSWTSPSFPSPLLLRRLHPHVHDFCCPLQVRLSQCLRFSVTVRSRMGSQSNRTTNTRRRRTGCSPLAKRAPVQLQLYDIKWECDRCSCFGWFISRVQELEMSLFLQFIVYHIIYKSAHVIFCLQICKYFMFPFQCIAFCRSSVTLCW